MPIELKYLLWSIALFFIMILAQSLSSIFSGKASVSELVGHRDNLPKEGLTKLHGRTKRAQANFIESLVMFVPLVLITIITESSTEITALGAALFLWGRLAFTPCYWLGVSWLRTLAWFVSIIGMLMIFLELIS